MGQTENTTGNWLAQVLTFDIPQLVLLGVALLLTLLLLHLMERAGGAQ